MLVLHDILGLVPGTHPKFVRTYVDGFQLLKEALTSWSADVREGSFPTSVESYTLPEALRPAVNAWERKA